MRKIILIIALLCCTTLCFGAIAENMPVKANSQQKQATQPMSFSAQTAIEQANAPANAAASLSAPIPKETLTILKQDSGKNFSEMNLTLFSAVNEFGMDGLGIGEAVRFEAPRPGWKLKGMQTVGWSGFNNTTKLFPADRTFLVEVRDENTDLLYKFVDIQNMYFASTTGPVAHRFEIPALSVTGDFYVIFYDRGSMGLGMERDNGTGNSYFLVNGQLLPAEFKTKNTSETLKVNWLIRAVGE
jgi:hypothetical protein